MVCGHAIRDGGGADAAIGEAVGALLIECCRDAEVAVRRAGEGECCFARCSPLV